MATKYHVSKNGTPGICKATQNCPLGGPGEHFDSVEGAQEYADKLNAIKEMEETSERIEEIAHNSLQNIGASERASLMTEMNEGVFNLQRQYEYAKAHDIDPSEIITPEKFKEYKKHKETADQKLEDYNKIQDEAKAIGQKEGKSDKWFDKIEEGRQKMYDHIKSRRDYRELRTQEEKDNEEPYVRYNSHADPNNPYNFHPDVDDTTRWQYEQVITSYSGMSKDEVKAAVAEKMKAGLNETEAHRELFKEVPLRSDKPIIMIDIETSGFRDAEVLGKLDNGERSEILEVGYIVRYPDGSMKKVSDIYKTDEKLTNLVGTGFEDVHHISVDEMNEKGLQRLADNTEKQREIHDDLKGAVMIAHNANFERARLSHNVRGVGKLFDNKEIEILDTMHVSKFYMPDNERNTNQSFVENTGGEYTGAHRAYQDAWMSTNALFRLKGEPELEIDDNFQ